MENQNIEVTDFVIDTGGYINGLRIYLKVK